MKLLLMAMIVVFFCTGLPLPVFADLKDNSDGTVTDTSQGLVWLKNADCFGKQMWSDASKTASELKSGMCGLTDNSVPGDWRLPTAYQLKSRALNKSGFTNVRPGYYWSSTVYTYAGNNDFYWAVHLDAAIYNGFYKTFYFNVWPVRSMVKK